MPNYNKHGKRGIENCDFIFINYISLKEYVIYIWIMIAGISIIIIITYAYCYYYCIIIIITRPYFGEVKITIVRVVMQYINMQ